MGHKYKQGDKFHSCICPGESNNGNRSEFAIWLELKSTVYSNGWNKKWYEELEMSPMVLTFMA